MVMNSIDDNESTARNSRKSNSTENSDLMVMKLLEKSTNNSNDGFYYFILLLQALSNISFDIGSLGNNPNTEDDHKSINDKRKSK